ncbi:probable ATP-dependent RNA helicase DDX20 [Stegostoma tigrinum]|uniref:probable ATP-dependent RNA helicase DDX20 n=1 Tax=Stegostoma tigrinum TaxID=3053191 RepID=UPI00202AC931|nr:probable ATP-dependent RNA helicase DDX20 [Stegostoma tigrinum]
MALTGRRTAHSIDRRPRTGDVLLAPGEQVDFAALLLTQPVLEGLREAGFERPSPIQLKAIPLGRCGLDLIVQAKSGTGKTCVFATIALDSVILENPATQVLVLAPTREIAVQIHSVITAIGIKMEGLECHVFIGGTPLNLDKMRLKKCHIAVGSPGRIKQLIEIGFLPTASIRLFILDEADKLLEEGSFQEQINWIYSSLPSNKQMVALSATYPESLAHHLTRYMRDPNFVRLNPTDPSLIGLKQFYKVVNSYPLPHKIFEEKMQHLLELFSKIPFNQALVFSNLHSRAQRLADILTSKGLPAVCISGSMNQNQRLEAMSKLKQYKCRVLISTDLTSRGIDAEKVNLVVNLDVPQDWETYMHRIGRAGRFGTQGLAVTYCCRGEEENELELIAQRCNLHLLSLPDPIPSGLLEEPIDWDVEVIKVHGDKNPAPAATPMAAEIEPSVSQEHTISKPLSLSPAKLAGRKFTTKKIVKLKEELTENKTQECLAGDVARTPEISICHVPTEIKMKVQANLQDAMLCDVPRSSAEPVTITMQDRKALQESLPKIPPLTLFKKRSKRRRRSLSFVEIVEDYESFLAEREEKPVEIVRQWTGFTGILKEKSTNETEDSESRELMSQERNSRLFLSKDDLACLHNSQRWAKPTELDDQDSSDSSSSTNSSTCSRTSSRESSTEAEVPVNPHAHNDNLLRKVTSPDPEDFPNRSEKSLSAFQSLAQQGGFKDEAAANSFSGVSPKRPLEIDTGLGVNCSPVKGSAPKGSRKRSKADPKLASAETDKASTITEKGSKDAGGQPLLPSESQCSGDYWKAYYRAWRNYYATIGYPYYGSSKRHSDWLRAYQMNSVYLQELFKP